MLHRNNHSFCVSLPITALELLDSVYLCDVLSTGQLLFQVLQLCTHNGFAPKSLLFLG
jgi:hypothetical protein